MKIVLTIVLMTFLSCRSNPPRITDKIQCGLFLSPTGSGLFTGKCRCRPYQWTLNKLGATGPSYDIPLEKCNKLTGLLPDDYGKHFLELDDLREWLRDEVENKLKEANLEGIRPLL